MTVKSTPTPQDFSRMAYAFMHMIREHRRGATLDMPEEIVVSFPLSELQTLEDEGWSLDFRIAHDPDAYEWRITRRA
jgi:hypothetical protein